METRANYALIGLFTLAVIAAAFGFVYWFSGGDRGQARQSVRVVFAGSVSGLSKGSIASFNGLRVGEVTEISLLPEDPRRVVAIIQVEGTTPIRADTRARLEYQGLTGVAAIALTGGEPGAPPLVAGPGQPLPTIFADRSDFQDLIESARNIARRADDVMERVSRVITDNEAAINRTVQNVEKFSQALGENADGIDSFLAQIGQAAEKVGPLAEKLETLAANLDEVVRSVDRERVARIVENVDNFTTSLSDSRKDISKALADAATLVGRLNDSAPKLDSALTDINNLAKAIDPPRSAGSSTMRTCSARPCGSAARTSTRRSARRGRSPRSSTNRPTRSTRCWRAPRSSSAPLRARRGRAPSSRSRRRRNRSACSPTT